MHTTKTNDTIINYKGPGKGETLYRGYLIKPSQDFGFRERKIKGWVVTKDGCNPMPGACGFEQHWEALDAIDVLEFVGGEENADHFWEIMQPPLKGYVVGQIAPDYFHSDLVTESSMQCGRFYAKLVKGIVVKMGITKVEPWDGKPALVRKWKLIDPRNQ